MGRKARPTPERLGEKLLLIRNKLRLSQSEMFRRLDAEDLIAYKQISKYELGITEPPLQILLRYARAANISTDVLIDDELDIPATLPAKPKTKEKPRR
jgi:transcriptional regulator with XRE-family HTH domain